VETGSFQTKEDVKKNCGNVGSQMTTRERDVNRIVEALEAAGKIYRSRSIESVRVDRKSSGDPVTDAEREVNQLLFEMLVNNGDGWLSEESADNENRLTCSRVWLVDPLDGTKEYVSGIPEWCVSIALLDEGRLVAGGIYNPSTGELLYGSQESGLVCRNDLVDAPSSEGPASAEAIVLASRSEVKRGEWERFRNAPFQMQPMGSVAYKLARVAAGKADATWTLVPKHEWDVAAGAAILLIAGGCVLTSEGFSPSFNKKNPRFPGLVGFSAVGLERLSPFFELAALDLQFQDCLSWIRPLMNRSLRA
jgi:myo-inositol-1(or 4)-monophosphatase